MVARWAHNPKVASSNLASATILKEEKNYKLDMRGIPCPMNYVRTKFQLEKMSSGEVLELVLDEGEAIESVSNSVIADGIDIIFKKKIENHWLLKLRKPECIY